MPQKASGTRWRQVESKHKAGEARHDRIMEAIEHEVRGEGAFTQARPHAGQEWVTAEWTEALRVFGRLRDNYTDLAQGVSYRDHVKALLTCLPDELVEYAPEVAAPGATQDVIFKGLWNLLKKHQGEAVLVVVCVCARACVRACVRVCVCVCVCALFFVVVA